MLKISIILQHSSIKRAEAARFGLAKPVYRLGSLAGNWFKPLTHVSKLKASHLFDTSNVLSCVDVYSPQFITYTTVGFWLR